jgi:hypothetical protein
LSGACGANIVVDPDPVSLEWAEDEAKRVTELQEPLK